MTMTTTTTTTNTTNTTITGTITGTGGMDAVGGMKTGTTRSTS
jgi:hypothetical protein